MAVIIAAFYDEDPGEPDQAIRDILTDLAHEADTRDVDIHDALTSTLWMRDQELADWGVNS